MINKTNKTKFEIPKNFPDHPGGERTLDEAREHAHKEILFLTYHIGLDIDGKIAQQAKLKGVQLPAGINSPLYREIHHIVQKVKKEHPEQFLVYQAWCMLLTWAIPAALFAFIWTGNFVSVAALQVCLLSYVNNVFHMRNHRGKVYETKWLDDWTSPLYDFIDGVAMTHDITWRKNHNLNHHVFTNDPVNDHDILVPAGVGIRLCPDQPYYWYHRYQPIYIPMVFAISVLLYPLENYLVHGASIVYLLIHYALFWALPIWFHGWYAFWLMTGGFVWIGLVIDYVVQVTHNHPDCHNPETRKVIHNNNNNKDTATATNGEKEGEELQNYDIDEYIYRQISESISWGGYIPTLLIGGINLQIEHHLAPGLPPVYYYYMKPYIQDFAQRHGFVYTQLDSFWSAVDAYNRHVYAMSLGSSYPHKVGKKKKGI